MGLFSKKEYIYSKYMLTDLLPVGSVITIKNKNGKYVIMDYGGFIKESFFSNIYHEMDYVCSDYPTVSNEVVNISHDDIDKVIFTGYDSDKRQKFLYDLQSYKER